MSEIENDCNKEYAYHELFDLIESIFEFIPEEEITSIIWKSKKYSRLSTHRGKFKLTKGYLNWVRDNWEKLKLNVPVWKGRY